MSLIEYSPGVLLLENYGSKYKFKLNDVVSLVEDVFNNKPDCWITLVNKQQINMSKEDFDILDKNFCET